MRSVYAAAWPTILKARLRRARIWVLAPFHPAVHGVVPFDFEGCPF
jgi:hypothetical protein